jgi:hypothetical protein
MAKAAKKLVPQLKSFWTGLPGIEYNFRSGQINMFERE